MAPFALSLTWDSRSKDSFFSTVPPFSSLALESWPRGSFFPIAAFLPSLVRNPRPECSRFSTASRTLASLLNAPRVFAKSILLGILADSALLTEFAPLTDSAFVVDSGLLVKVGLLAGTGLLKHAPAA